MSNNNESQNRLDSPPILRDGIIQFLNVKKYLATRKAIIRLEFLWNYSFQELDARGYQSPWTFNLQQSTLSALPAILVFQFLEFLFPAVQVVTPGLTPLEQYALEVYPRIAQVLFSFLVPLDVMLLSYIAAWASLRKTDRTKKNFNRNLAAFLYLDGALGLWPEMSVSLTFALSSAVFSFAQVNEQTIIILLILVLILLAYGLLYGYYIIRRIIPKTLFALQGYASDRRRFFWQKKVENEGPWRAWWWATWFGPWVILIILLIALIAISIGAAKVDCCRLKVQGDW